MSAAELIEQIKALSPADLKIVRSFILEEHEKSMEASDIKYVERERARELGVKIMEENEELFRKLAQ